jgi:hypothetical protein
LPPSDDQLIRMTSANALRIASELLEPLSRFLNVARDHCGGDTDKVLLMVGIVLRASLHPRYGDLTPRQIEDGEVHILPSLGANYASLSDSIGIPRETVRRKVLELIEQGWVARRGRQLFYTREGYLAVAASRDALIRMTVRSYQIESRLVASDAAEPLSPLAE